MRSLLLAACLALAACDERPQITAVPSRVEPGAVMTVHFDRPVQGTAIDQYWVVVAPAGAPEDYADNRVHIDRLTTSVSLAIPQVPGKYELRLHGDFPRKPFHVVQTLPFEVGASRTISLR